MGEFGVWVFGFLLAGVGCRVYNVESVLGVREEGMWRGGGVGLACDVMVQM